MSAITMPAKPPLAERRAAAGSRPGIARLTAVELRKMTDTRAGFWLLVTIGLGYAALVAIMLFAAEPVDLTFRNLFQMTMIPSGVLLPVLGILAVTSEWTQRTALTTFTLVPERSRVAVAKLLAAVALAAASVAVSVAVASAGNVVGSALFDGDGAWNLGGWLIPFSLLAQVINIVMGVAFGMVLMNSALAIVVYFMLPTLWSVLGEMVKALQTPAQWLDLGVTTQPLLEGSMGGQAWAKLATASAVWVLLPLLAGWTRLLKREVS
jgi:ABC-2 type transport system permease protein